MCDTDIGELPMSAYEHLGQDALCAICYQPSQDNVSMCKQGHNACRTCADKVWNSQFADKCPIGCSELHRPGGAWVSNRALNEVIKVTPFKCPNSEGGCKHSSRLSEMKAHTDDCGYEEVACQVRACKWRGPKCKWSEHMDEVDHSRSFVDMLLFTQHTIVTADKELKETKAELTALKQATEHKDDAVDKRLGVLNDLLDPKEPAARATGSLGSATRRARRPRHSSAKSAGWTPISVSSRRPIAASTGGCTRLTPRCRACCRTPPRAIARATVALKTSTLERRWVRPSRPVATSVSHVHVA
jgi:hypothetical protein